MKNLRALIREEIEKVLDENLLNEYLRTVSAEHAIKALELEPKYGLGEKEVLDNGNSIKIVFLKFSKEYFDHINIRMEELGWFPARIGSWTNAKEIDFILQHKKGKEVLVVYRKKFDDSVDVAKYKYLYHATSDIAIESIKKIGLVPKSKNNKSVYPERIFFMSTEEKAADIALGAEGLSGYWKNKAVHPKDKIPEKVVILKIDTSKVPGLKLYKDLDSGGFYTTNSIHPNAIDIVDIIDPSEGEDYFNKKDYKTKED